VSSSSRQDFSSEEDNNSEEEEEEEEDELSSQVHDEYEGVRVLLEGSDFYRGMQPTLTQWSPSTLAEMVDEYISPLGEHEWTIPSTTSNL
jgi:hypothetical protein